MKCRFLFVAFSRVTYLRGLLHVRKQKIISNYIIQYLDWALVNHIGTFENPNVRKNKTIWFLWTQGIDNAPLLVKKCYQSLLKYKEDYDVIVLTKENLKEYICLPKYVEKLYNEKKMSEALHSDMIRLYLLIHYGGIWRDATCFQSSPYPDYVKNYHFFMFSSDLLSHSLQPIICSNWFIKAEYNNRLLVKTYNFLCEYHKRYSKPHDYYIFHLVLSVLAKKDEECKQIWDTMPYVCNMNPHALFFSWSKIYIEKDYQHLLSLCFIHKLTYKYPASLLKTKVENMLQHILNS